MDIGFQPGMVLHAISERIADVSNSLTLANLHEIIGCISARQRHDRE